MSEWVVTAGEAGEKLGNFIRDNAAGAGETFLDVGGSSGDDAAFAGGV